jgi:hypothetical protein
MIIVGSQPRTSAFGLVLGHSRSPFQGLLFWLHNGYVQHLENMRLFYQICGAKEISETVSGNFFSAFKLNGNFSATSHEG